VWQAEQVGWSFTNYTSLYYQFSSEMQIHSQLLKSPVLTLNPEEANLFFVPFYVSIYRRLQFRYPHLASQLNQFLINQKYLRRRNGLDHVVILSCCYTGEERKWLHGILPALKNSIVCSADIGPRDVFAEDWPEGRNVVIPYVSFDPNVGPCPVSRKKTRNIFLSMNRRPGSIGGLRARISNLMSNMSESEVQVAGLFGPNRLRFIAEEMRQSKYCVVPRGDTASSKRFYDAMRYGCLPVVLSDNFRFAYENIVIDDSEFVVRIPQRDVDALPHVVKSISEEHYRAMREKMFVAAEKIALHHGQAPRIGDGFWSLSWVLYAKYLFLETTRQPKGKFEYFSKWKSTNQDGKSTNSGAGPSS
jgi:hypothetical protein